MNKILRIGGVPEHFNLPWKQALADDAFSPTGVDVQYVDCPAGTGQMTSALRSNELDAALVLTEGAVADIVANDSNRLVKVYVDSPLIWGIHVSTNGDITDIDAIKGKRIAISRYGSGSHLIAIVDAAARGWPSDDLSFVVVNDLPGARAALAAGDAEVFLWERFTTQALVDSGEFRRIGQREVPWPAFCVSVRREYLASAGAELRGILDIVAGYAAKLKAGKDSARLIADTYDIPFEDASRWLQSVQWNNDYRRPDTALQRVAAALEAQAVIPPALFNPDNIWASIA